MTARPAWQCQWFTVASGVLTPSRMPVPWQAGKFNMVQGHGCGPSVSQPGRLDSDCQGPGVRHDALTVAHRDSLSDGMESS
jgi:hypothetical protein